MDLKKDDINCVVSLNYDLVVEEVLSYLAIKYRRFGVINEQEGIPIFKPHGSIDYTHNGINLPVRYPINTVCYGNDTLLKSISNNELLKPRNAVDIVPPTQSTEISDFQWVKCGYEYLKKYGKNIEKLIICGVSYWGCDKMEIDKMIESIHPNCNVININPDKTSPGICEFKNIIVSKVGVKRYKQLDDIKELLEL